MKSMFALTLAVWIAGAACGWAEKPAASDVTPLFNGKDLAGWEGREDLWSVEQGAIVGRTTAEDPIKANTFLIWKGGQPENFELALQFKIEGGNSGIQYRSKIIDEKEFIVGGYQADIDFTNKFAGILYEEKGRGILATRGEKTTIGSGGKKAKQRFAEAEALGKGIHPGQWNDYRVVAQGNRLQHFINGALTAEVIDEQADKSAAKGVIALQLHRGPPMVVRFKNISLSQLK
jgi:hypothetical protein